MTPRVPVVAVVVGGGPAGSLAGLLLARAGWRVELLESHAFPRHKVCGECLSVVGLGVLRRAGLAGRVESLGPAWLRRTLLHPADGPAADVPLPGEMWGVTRAAMDVVLLAAAANAGVLVRQPARCESISLSDGPEGRAVRRESSGPPLNKRVVRWRDLRTNVVHATEADWVIVADGKGALLPAGVPAATGDLGVKAHFAGVDGPRDAIELFAGDGCYGGLAAVEGGRWNAAWSVPAAVVRRCRGDLAAAFAEVAAFNPALAGRLRHATRLGPWLAAPLPRFPVRGDWPDRVVPVGNAAAALEPVGGEGMGLALRSAELAVAAVLSGTVADLPRAFARLWAVRRAVCRGVAMTFARPAVADAVAPLMAAAPRLPAAVMRWAGKAG